MTTTENKGWISISKSQFLHDPVVSPFSYLRTCTCFSECMTVFTLRSIAAFSALGVSGWRTQNGQNVESKHTSALNGCHFGYIIEGAGPPICCHSVGGGHVVRVDADVISMQGTQKNVFTFKRGKQKGKKKPADIFGGLCQPNIANVHNLPCLNKTTSPCRNKRNAQVRCMHSVLLGRIPLEVH